MMPAPDNLNLDFEGCIEKSIRNLEAKVEYQKLLNSYTIEGKISQNKLQNLKDTRDSIPSPTEAIKPGDPAHTWTRWLFGPGLQNRIFEICGSRIIYRDLNGNVKGYIYLSTILYNNPETKREGPKLFLKAPNRTWELIFENDSDAKCWWKYLKKNFAFLEVQRFKHERDAEKEREECERAKIQAEMATFKDNQKKIERVTREFQEMARGFQQMTPEGERELDAELKELLMANS